MNRFCGVSFNDDDENAIAIINAKWLTPLKREAFWPPYKYQNQYEKAIKNSEEPKEGVWTLYKIKKIYFELDDFDQAKRKLRKLEFSSDIQTSDVEEKFKKQILTLLEKLFNQNAEIIKYIQANKAHSASKQSLPTLPVSLPLHSEDNLITLEEYLRLSDESVIALIQYLSTLGGRDTTNKINIILKFLFTDEVASTYSFYGKRLNKKPFHQLI
ncbi:hypothetical protein MML48_9g00016783 [Holotrichia oblita]|uniref:Uncharacterized protein n=1 Tax=Holotrichia oblita TaxID=644536 RepID=A0ACB9SKQ4_HOLOL|nr:hypothetical protein MML48_9g00016783 [Holotrichia oblita]